MLGFELNAWGSNGFKQKRGAWTEGSLMALKVLALAGSRVNKDKLGEGQSGMLSSIESSFKKFADQRFASICAMGLSSLCSRSATCSLL